MGTVRNLWWKLIAKPTYNLRYALVHANHLMWLEQDYQTHRKDMSSLIEQLDQLDLGGVPRTYPGGVPQWTIGDAAALGHRLGITLDIGTDYGNCRAVLDKEKWKHDIAPGADVWSYSLFCKQDPKTVDCIQGMSRWADVAITQCAINAKKAGVI